MTLCANCHEEHPTRAYRYALGRRTTTLCDECFGSLTAIGMALSPIERREVDIPPVVERRRLARPRWLDHLAAKVLDHGAAA